MNKKTITLTSIMIMLFTSMISTNANRLLANDSIENEEESVEVLDKSIDEIMNQDTREEQKQNLIVENGYEVKMAIQNSVTQSIGDIFTGSIYNNTTATDIDCTYKIIKEDSGSGDGEVQVGSGNYNQSAISSQTGQLTIPETVSYNGLTYKVTKVADYAFYNQLNITSVGLATNTSINEIGDYAFEKCENLLDTGLASNTSITKIGMYSFSRCNALLETGLASNSTLIDIGDDAFALCQSLQKTGLESNTTLTKIPAYMFAMCNSLTTTGLESNNTIIEIKENAFHHSNALKSTGLETNTSVKVIGNLVFSGCISLTSTGLQSNATVETVGLGAFAFCESLKTTGLETNESVSSLGFYAFHGCISLESTGLETNTKITVIEGDAFSGCISLKSTGLETNKSVTTIDSRAFADNTELKSIVLNEDTKWNQIDSSVFENCLNLDSFVITGKTIPTFTGSFTNVASTFAIYYPINVVNGNVNVDGTNRLIQSSVPKNDIATISAQTINGKRFKQWNVVAGDVVLADPKNPTTTFEMVDDYVEVVAEYDDIVYTIEANNFAIHVNALEDMDIDALSGVVASANVANEKATYTRSGRVEAMPKVYTISYTCVENPNVKKDINVYVYDDNAILSNDQIIYKNDFALKYSEKHLLTQELIVSKITAYTISTGRDVTSLITLNESDLLHVRTTEEIGTHPIHFYLNTDKSRIVIEGTIEVTIIDDKEIVPDHNPTDTPNVDNTTSIITAVNTNDQTNSMLYGMMLFTGLVVFGFLVLKRKINKK